MARFTIAIPTYNRSGYLKRSLDCALSQTATDVEILVSDNASTDSTAEVVRSFGDRVRSHRNESNIGATANFEKALELADTEFFSWLQDDDLIHRDFVQHARQGLTMGPDVDAYLCFSIITPSPTTVFQPMLSGPTFPIGWMQGEMSLIDGVMLAPVSLFYSPGNPPSVAYRTDSLKAAIRSAKHRCELFDERIILATVAMGRKVALDPWPGAIFTHHANQSYQVILRDDPKAQERQWYVLADAIGELLEGQGDAWKDRTRQLFQGVDGFHRLVWLNNYCPPAPDAYKRAHPIAREVRALLVESLPDALRPLLKNGPGERSVGGRVKSIAKDLVPPLIARSIKALRTR